MSFRVVATVAAWANARPNDATRPVSGSAYLTRHHWYWLRRVTNTRKVSIC
jgi:hypothetical protein